MEPDYPASHSMDTQWFAVDRDGHVASFYSGEAGAVPKQAQAEGTAWDRVLPLLPNSGAAYDPKGRIRPGPDAEAHPHQVRPGLNIVALMFLRSIEAVRAELDA